MKIVFIKAPQTYLLDPDRNPPLGMMYIAAVAKELGHDVEYADFSTKEEGSLDFVSAVPSADVYALTVSIMDYHFCHELARALKKREKCFIVFGGMFPTTSTELVEFDAVDAIIRGEGEASFREVLEDIQTKGSLRKEYVSAPVEDLDSLPFPLREGIKFTSNHLLKGGMLSTTIITSRGCPFDCTFCASKTIWGTRVRFRSVENVLAEIDFLIDQHGVQGLRFLDDTITLRPERFTKLCAGLKERNMTWRCSTRSNLVAPQMAEMMKSSGCIEVGIGVESADPKILELAKKKVKVEEHERAIRVLKEAGMEVACFFIAGLPGENDQTPDLNIEFIKRTQPDRVFCTTLMPYPGTDLWDHPEKYKLQILHRDVARYNQVSGQGEEEREFAAIPEGMTVERLFKNRKKIIDFLAKEHKF